MKNKLKKILSGVSDTNNCLFKVKDCIERHHWDNFVFNTRLLVI